MNLIEVENLRVTVPGYGGPDKTIVHDVSFAVPEGEVTALIGESGSGKTTIALALMGYARPGCHLAGGRIVMEDGRDILALPPAAMRALRGNAVAYVPQSAAAAFNPARRVIDQVIESALIHGQMSRAAAEEKAVALFRTLALPEPETLGARYPHQFSGGQLQRLAAAMAMLLEPRLVIFDEPTTALDVTTQIEVLHAFKRMIREHGVTGVYVSHDLAVVAQMADQIITLKDGRIQETGRTRQMIEAPAHPYTQSLLAAAHPVRQDTGSQSAGGRDKVLEVRNLVGGYGPVREDRRPLKVVVDDVSFAIRQGSNLGVIGESGSGKSSLARMIAGLLPAADGDILLNGRELPRDLRARGREQLRDIQIVFQMADTALNPSVSVGEILARPLRFYKGMRGAAQKARVRELLEMVKLSPAMIHRRPGELSGGQKQRLNLARALAAEPRLILCDEVTSALDTVVAARIIELLAELQRELGLSYMFISHDLSIVEAICDRVLVLYEGKCVETGAAETVLTSPAHSYTRLLLASIPQLDPGWLDRGGARPGGQINLRGA